eukprot:scaffold119678_cov57-Phaeocystis_antarctica.AAC.4
MPSASVAAIVFSSAYPRLGICARAPASRSTHRPTSVATHQYGRPERLAESPRKLLVKRSRFGVPTSSGKRVATTGPGDSGVPGNRTSCSTPASSPRGSSIGGGCRSSGIGGGSTHSSRVVNSVSTVTRKRASWMVGFTRSFAPDG